MHSWSAIPNLLTDCGKRFWMPDKIFDDLKGPINPTLNSTYIFLREFFGEVRKKHVTIIQIIVISCSFQITDNSLTLSESFIQDISIIEIFPF